MKKKCVLLLTIVCACLTFSGCGKNDEGEFIKGNGNSSDTVSTEAQTVVSGELTDEEVEKMLASLEDQLGISSNEDSGESDSDETSTVRKSYAKDDVVAKEQMKYINTFHSEKGNNLIMKIARLEDDDFIKVNSFTEFINDVDNGVIIQYDHIFVDNEKEYKERLERYKDSIIEKDDNAFYIKILTNPDYSGGVPGSYDVIEQSFIDQCGNEYIYVD